MAQVKSKRISNDSKPNRRLMTLITSGCSFSETITTAQTWPTVLEKYLAPKNVNHLGLGSQGNGMISRKAIHAIHNALKTTSSKNLLVGIMWSSPSRHEQYVSGKVKFGRNIDNWMINPTSVVDNDQGGWVIYNSSWDIPQAKNYYRNMYDPIFSQIQTLEHVIRVQNYLKLHNIKYFMSTYTNEVFAIKNNPNLDYLYEQINFDYFLPVEGCYEWARDVSRLPFNNPGDLHPTKHQHRLFTQQVILPFLKDKYNIDTIN